MTNENLPPRIHVLAKPTGAACNLNCSYCFFLNKERLYPGSHFRMSDEVLEIISGSSSSPIAPIR